MPPIEKIILNTPIMAIFIVFWAGVVASMSSCTFVRIPVISGYVAGASHSKKKAFLITISFVAGLIVSYTMLGISIGMIGNFTGILINASKVIYRLLGIFLIVSGLFFSGLIEIRPKRHADISTEKFKKKGYLGAFLFGVVFAFLEMPACPCCSSVLLVISSVVVLKGSFAYSLMIFFSFALGQSFPILLIGSSTGILKYLTPKIEKSEEWIKFIAGNVLIVLGICFFIIA